MGEHEVVEQSDSEQLRVFTRALLEDVRALERMLEEQRFETGIRRIGAEQEVFLIDPSGSPVLSGPEILERLSPEWFTAELGRFNLEVNLAPREFGGDCLEAMGRELEVRLSELRTAAAREGAQIVLAGILPTLKREHLTLDAMTPGPRYAQLNRVMTQAAGGTFVTSIKGHDELSMRHDNVMLEACNTSFQIHFQVAPDEFAGLYNLAQLVTAPVLAGAVNSPVLMQHRLWKETRVALFQQSLDTRSQAEQARSHRTRVSFGERWVEESVIELIREDIARFRVMLATDLTEDPMAVLDAGGVPRLRAWCLHNGTIYRWNRPCYGVTKRPDGTEIAHLRIENRVLPAGPTPTDEMANAAFFFGLMSGLGDEIGDVRDALDFDDARANFNAAARYGLKARFNWLGGRTVSASDLILELIPVARRGLERSGHDADGIERLLGVLEQRATNGRTGAQWTLDSLSAMGKSGSKDARYRALVRAMAARESTGQPVHTWDVADASESGDWRESYRTVEQVMATDLFTVHPEDLVDLAASLMDWEHIRHVPVEDDDGKLVGIVSHRALLRYLGRGLQRKAEQVAVREIMRPDPVTVPPDMTTLEAIEKMLELRLSCLPVVRDGKLVGIVTEHDFLDVSRALFMDQLRQG
ncbi:CBS domain-containing protein [Engelhardtia mirabilis]|uniref:Inosine-5'-monophosphate dehydrogenase n=1 Tax=Engelhardtia mirabilis TaxID=2528011 RepID=A0A518BLJ2_9BACT|nr:Inosine-5'-monophosphate dehydrogenase [Planctomycetes bacterium Pla133]QDV02172.1 Inosine-5'-monophosphate dehydrogenase [Planctomycetes bacterium Pla86]